MKAPVGGAAKASGGTGISRKLWAVLHPFFTSENEHRKNAWGWLILMLALLVLESGVLVMFSYTQRDFSTAMSNKDQEGFYRGTRRYVILLLSAAPLFALSKFVQGKLGLDWRRWLTEHLCGLYFSNRAFYSLKIGYLSTGSTATGNEDRTAERRGKGEEQGGGLDNPVSAVDNPDQRIGEDIASFTENCISVLVVFVGSVLKVGSFVGVLLSISPRLTAFVVAYSLLGTFTTTATFGARLKHLIFEGAKREANFRFGLVRVREHAEEIAFYRGEKGEKEGVKGLLDRVVGNIHLRLRCDAQLAVFSNSFMWLTAVLPYLVVAERYFAGDIEFGVISQTAMAFRVIQNALSVIVTQIRTLASLASEVDRLHFLLVCMEGIAKDSTTEADAANSDGTPSSASTDGEGDDGFVAVHSNRGAQPSISTSTSANHPESMSNDQSDCASDQDAVSLDDNGNCDERRLTSARDRSIGDDNGRISSAVLDNAPGAGGNVFEIQDMTLLTPDRKETICRRLSFEVSRGQSVLIFGPSGCGKSSLLRAISGLWTAGRGKVRRHADEHTMFIPQKPYLPLGSLRAQMTYPRSEVDAGTSPLVLEDILERVQLGYLSERCGGLDTIRDWQDELSLGEQQRLAFSRLLTNMPSTVFLDEATSALDEANEAKLYAWVQASAADAFVSVGHRASLFRYHTHVLRGHGDGQWTLHTMEEFRERYYSPSAFGKT